MAFDRDDRDSFIKRLAEGFSGRDALGLVSLGNLLKGLAILATLFLIVGAGIYMWSQEIAKENCEHLTCNEEKTYVDFDKKQLIFNCDFCKKNIIYDAEISTNVVAEPSCNREGKITEIWEFPHGSFNQRISIPIPKIPHTLDEIAFEYEAPTCKSYGREILYRCSVCHEYVGGESIEPLGHDLLVSGFIDSTCTETGLTNSSVCTRCNYVEYEQEIIPLKDHIYEDVHHDTTYSTSGYIGKGCKICGHPSDEVEIIEAPFVSKILSYEIDMYGDYTITGLKVEKDEIIIPAYIDGIPVSSISSQAFANNTKIKKVIIEGKLGEIQSRAFYGCTNLEEINLDKVGIIGTRAFEATGLKKLSIGSSNIEQYAFKDCKELRFVSFTDDTHYIYDYAFQNCNRLWSVKLSRKAKPDHILGNNIFQGCTSLLEMIRPFWAGFEGMFPNTQYTRNNKDSNLETLIYYEDNCYFIDNSNGTVSLLLCEKDDDNLIIPDVDKNGKTIILKENCLEGIQATKLTIKKITSDVKFVSLFGNKEIKVKELTIDTLDYVSQYYINGKNANGLQSLKKIIFTPKTINFSTGGCINYCTSLEEIELPSNGTTLLKDVYSLDYSYSFRKVVINSGEIIPQYFFEDFNKLETIIFEEGVKEIKAYSLFGVEGLNVVLPKTIENIRPFSLYKVNFYYQGNESEWENVKKGYSNSPSIYYYSKDNPNKNGNYWYYDNEGNIKLWNN